MNLLDALADPKLFAPLFPGPTWRPWTSVLAGVYGLPNPDLAFFEQHAGRPSPPKPCRTFVCISGRRSGKSRIAALMATWAALARDYRKHLAPGEWADVLLFAVDMDQAGVLLSYVKGIFDEVPMLSRELGDSRSKDTLTLPKRRVRIAVKAGNFRAVRGRSVVLAVLDEAAFYRSLDESTLSAEELVTALKPSLATLPGSMLVAIGSPYARRGWFYEQYKKHFAQPGDTLVWHSGTKDMNPSLSLDVISDAFDADPIAADAEWNGNFRRDVESWLAPDALAQCVVPGRLELPPVPGVHYVAAIDPSGGSQDSFTCAVSHWDDQTSTIVLDAIRERKPPFSPDDVVSEYAALLKTYGVHRAVSDRYAGVWVAEPFAKLNVHVEQNAAPKSDVYRDALPLLNSARLELLDVPRLHSQLLSLERRTARGGRDSVDHPPGSAWHDDVANAAMLACASAQSVGDGGHVEARNLRSDDIAGPLPYRDPVSGMSYADEQPRDFYTDTLRQLPRPTFVR